MLFTLQQEVRRLYLFSVVSWPYLFLYQEWWLVWLGWGAEYYMPYMFLMVLDFIIILRVINFIIISNNKIISVRSVDNCRYSLWAFVSIYWIENSWYNSVFRSIAAPRIYSFLGGFLLFLSFFFFFLAKNLLVFYIESGTITKCHLEELNPLQYFVMYQKTKCWAGTLLSNSRGAATLNLIIQASL